MLKFIHDSLIRIEHKINGLFFSINLKKKLCELECKIDTLVKCCEEDQDIDNIVQELRTNINELKEIK